MYLNEMRAGLVGPGRGGSGSGRGRGAVVSLEEAQPGGEWALLSVASSSSPRAGRRLVPGSVTVSWQEGARGRKRRPFFSGLFACVAWNRAHA